MGLLRGVLDSVVVDSHGKIILMTGCAVVPSSGGTVDGETSSNPYDRYVVITGVASGRKIAGASQKGTSGKSKIRDFLPRQPVRLESTV